MMKRIYLWLLVIFLLGALIRIVSVLPIPSDFLPTTGDEIQYDTIAINIVSGNGFAVEPNQPTLYCPPLYPLFLALIYSIFGHNYLAVRLIQAIIGALTCLIVYFIGEKIMNRWVGILSATITAVYPTLITYTGPGELMAENLFTFLLCLAVLSIIWAIRKGLSVRLILAGFILGLAILTKPMLFPFCGLLFFYFLFNKNIGSFKKRIVSYLLLIISFGIVLVPWILRNYALYQKFVFTTQGGWSFWGGNNPLARGLWVKETEIDPDFITSIKDLDEVEQSKLCFKKGWEFLISSSPFHLIKLMIKKFAALWYFFTPDYMIDFGLLIPFTLLGLIVFFKEKGRDVLLYYILLNSVVMAIIFYGSIRFRIPILPYLILFGAFGLDWLWKRYSNKLIPIVYIVFIVLINLIIYLYAQPIRHLIKSLI